MSTRQRENESGATYGNSMVDASRSFRGSIEKIPSSNPNLIQVNRANRGLNDEIIRASSLRSGNLANAFGNLKAEVANIKRGGRPVLARGGILSNKSTFASRTIASVFPREFKVEASQVDDNGELGGKVRKVNDTFSFGYNLNPLAYGASHQSLEAMQDILPYGSYCFMKIHDDDEIRNTHVIHSVFSLNRCLQSEAADKDASFDGENLNRTTWAYVGVLLRLERQQRSDSIGFFYHATFTLQGQAYVRNIFGNAVNSAGLMPGDVQYLVKRKFTLGSEKSLACLIREDMDSSNDKDQDSTRENAEESNEASKYHAVYQLVPYVLGFGERMPSGEHDGAYWPVSMNQRQVSHEGASNFAFFAEDALHNIKSYPGTQMNRVPLIEVAVLTNSHF